MLKLSAQLHRRGKLLSDVSVFVNDGRAGGLLVDVEHAAELVNLLNAATELLAVVSRARIWHVACNCHSTASPDIPCLSCTIDAVLAKAEGANG